MRIRLLVDLPVEEKHGMTAGRVIDVVRQQPGSDREGIPRWFVQGDAGEEVGVFPREAEVVGEAG